ncbi:MAG: hypothetical protein ACT4PL_03235 [Phycisphaerales bacterium]
MSGPALHPENQDPSAPSASADIASSSGTATNPAAPRAFASRLLTQVLGLVLLTALIVLLATVVLPVVVILLIIAALAIVFLIGRASFVDLLARWRDPARARRNVTVRPPTDPEP